MQYSFVGFSIGQYLTKLSLKYINLILDLVKLNKRIANHLLINQFFLLIKKDVRMKLLGPLFVLSMLIIGCGSQNGDLADTGVLSNQAIKQNTNQSASFLDIKPANNLNSFVKPIKRNKASVEINGSVVEIGTLGGTETFVEQENNGYVVGGSNIPMPREEVESDDVSDLTVHAFVHKDGVIKDLGTLGGAYSSSSSVNSSGIVVGGSQIANGSYQAFKYENNTMSALPNLSGGNHSWAYSINNGGYIVGEAKNASGAFKAVLWQNGTIIELNSLLPANSGWDLTSAKSISNTGAVTGVGKFNGQKTFFQLNLNITE